MSAEVRQAYDLRFLNVGEPARTPFRHLGVKGSQVQILSARPAHTTGHPRVPRFVHLRGRAAKGQRGHRVPRIGRRLLLVGK